jgi:hypothetical protein
MLIGLSARVRSSRSSLLLHSAMTCIGRLQRLNTIEVQWAANVPCCPAAHTLTDSLSSYNIFLLLSSVCCTLSLPFLASSTAVDRCGYQSVASRMGDIVSFIVHFSSSWWCHAHQSCSVIHTSHAMRLFHTAYMFCR